MAFARTVGFISALIMLSTFAAHDAAAKGRKSQPKVDRHAAIVVDADSGKVLHASNATARRHPASLTKMMTLYLTFEALEKGKLKLGQSLPVSRLAAMQPATNLSMKPGDTIPVKKAIEALVVRSANDVAVVVAEKLGGSESEFARLMTQKARGLGMKNTTFRNASGLPDERQVTTARDMAILGMALKRHFPQYYDYFSTESFVFNGREYTTHNRVLEEYEGADGLKTGYIRASGFNLATSAVRGKHRLVGVVLGGDTSRARDAQMMALLDKYFGQMIAGKTGNASADIVVAGADTGKAAVGMPKPNPRRSYATPASLTAAVYNEVAPQAGAIAEEVQASVVAAAAAPVVPTISAPMNTAMATWGIQVGAFAESNDAVAAASRAQALAQAELASARTRRTPAAAFTARGWLICRRNRRRAPAAYWWHSSLPASFTGRSPGSPYKSSG